MSDHTHVRGLSCIHPRRCALVLFLVGLICATPGARLAAAAAGPDPPAAPLKLIFIHHSCGENWLTDGNGGLGLALRDNHYFVSDTNYGWGPDGIGDNTDIGHWWDWFRGPQSAVYLAALFAESEQHSSYSRLAADPGGENQIVLFKSCYPNSHLGGDPTDPPTAGDNPLRGASAYSDYHTVANAKGIYTDLLTGTQRITLTAENCGGIVTATHLIHIAPPLRLYLPVILRMWSPGASPPLQLTPMPPSGERLDPGVIIYLGAFRLPGGEERPETFAYGGNAMTFNPDGDPASDDGYPGSLFITGHDRLAYGELPDGGQVAEVAIPAPTVAGAVADLPTATFVQGFHDVAAGHFTDLEEIPKLGLQVLDHAETGPLLHLCWGQHLQPQDAPSHAWVNADLAAPDFQGRWFIGDQNLYSTNGYMFDIPAAWADAHTGGRMLATGRMRDGGQGGMGPALFAYRPWLPGGAAPASGARLSEVTLLRYASADATPDIVHSLQGYQHPDEWEGGAWITTPEGDAVLFAGTKATGAKYWYGYIHPDGPERPCVDAAVTDYVTCRLADGTPCPAADFAGCCDEGAESCLSGRGWWSSRFDAQFILYDPADLARVAAGTLDPWAPQPYATLDIDAHLFLDPPVWDEIVLGWGDQRRYRIGAVAYDRQHGNLYVLETYADGGKPVVHVWRIGVSHPS